MAHMARTHGIQDTQARTHARHLRRHTGTHACTHARPTARMRARTTRKQDTHGMHTVHILHACLTCGRAGRQAGGRAAGRAGGCACRLTTAFLSWLHGGYRLTVVCTLTMHWQATDYCMALLIHRATGGYCEQQRDKEASPPRTD